MFPFRPVSNSTVNISAGTSSTRIAITDPGVQQGGALRIYNSSAVNVFVAIGDVTVTASTSTNMPIAPGSVEVVQVPAGATYVAAIVASGSGNVIYFTSGVGL